MHKPLGDFVKAPWRSSAYRWRVLAAATIALGGVALAPTDPGIAASAAVNPADTTPTRVIVEAQTDGLPAVSLAAERLGGAVVSTQQSLGTMVVDVPAQRVDELREAEGVQNVTPNRAVRLSATNSTTGSTGDLTNVARETGATTFWRNGYSGQGVDVALLDSGVLPVQGLMTPNKLVIGPDLSFESQTPSLRGMDTFGHGTHMAGIIAGRDSGTGPSTYTTDTSKFVGMAPGSRVVSIKLADAAGRTDVSQVIAGIDWVVAHAHDPGMNIRVLNLSFGTDSMQDYRIDPLAHAAEVAWASGIVVVVSAGNGNVADGGLANPAYDPALLAVGTVDTKGTTDFADDTVAGFSKTGSSALGKRGPDLVAPGVSLVSLRAPGSLVDLAHSTTGAVGERFFKGSGTSQSAAVVSGASALILSKRPDLNPDQVRDILRRSARSLNGVTADAQGDGALDLNAAYPMGGRAVAAARVHTGGGSLDASRGTKKVKKNGVTLSGEQDIFGRTTDTQALANQENNLASDPALAAGNWAGGPLSVASGATWNGATWAGATWAGATWAGATWAGGAWDGATWAGATWTGATWAGATWAGATWAGATWAGATWAGATWADAQWADALWASASWE